MNWTETPYFSQERLNRAIMGTPNQDGTFTGGFNRSYQLRFYDFTVQILAIVSIDLITTANFYLIKFFDAKKFLEFGAHMPLKVKT